MNDLLKRIHDTYNLLFVSQQAQLNVLYRRLHSRINEEASKAEINEILNKIFVEVESYFRNEEDFLSLLLCEGMNEHKIEHAQVLHSLKAYQTKYVNGGVLLLKINDLIEIIKTRIDSHRLEISRVLENSLLDSTKFLGAFSDGKELSVKVGVFDIQHRNIDFLMQHIIEKVKANDNPAQIATLIFELSEKFKSHFNQEEVLMKKYRFPLYNEHKQDHDFFLGKLEDFRCFYVKGDVNLVAFEKIYAEINEHIIEHDVKYTEFFNELGIS